MCKQEITANKLKIAILRIVRDKVEYGWSQPECLLQLHNLFDLTGGRQIPHEKWDQVTAFLQTLGYNGTKAYEMCISDTHVSLLDYKEDCTICGKDWGSSHKYHVIGLKVESIFLSRETIIEHLAHWRGRDDWFNKDVITVPRKEIWHGERFR